MGNLTNTQAAYRMPYLHDEFLNRLNERAKALFADGYEVREKDPDDTVFLVWHSFDQGLRNAYQVDPVHGTCTCAFYMKQWEEPLREDGRFVPCKHLLGFNRLVNSQLAYFDQRFDEADGEGRADLRALYTRWHHNLLTTYRRAKAIYYRQNGRRAR